MDRDGSVANTFDERTGLLRSIDNHELIRLGGISLC